MRCRVPARAIALAPRTLSAIFRVGDRACNFGQDTRPSGTVCARGFLGARNRLTRHQEASSPLWRATRVATAYAAVATLWILLSDAVLDLWLDDPAAITGLQTAKGVAFVVITGGVLLTLLYRQYAVDARLVRQLAEQGEELRELSQFRQGVIDNASVWITVLDPEARVIVWNKAAEQISGYPRETVVGNDRVWSLLYPDPQYRAAITAKAGEVLADGEELSEFQTTIRCSDGRDRVMAWHSRRFFDGAGRIAGSIALGRDVTERTRAREALVARERQLAILMSNLPGMAYRCLNDRSWTMRFVSDGCRALCGYAPDALIDNRDVSYAGLIVEADRQPVDDAVQSAIRADTPFTVEYRLRHRDGHQIWVSERGQAVTVDGETVLEGIVMDVSERKRMEQELATLAARDSLTGLHNRREMERRFSGELTRARRSGRPLALLWIDVDHFKSVNDRFGHLAGDTVLRTLGQRLELNVREGDYVARFGGEELAVVLPEQDMAAALETAERLRERVAEAPIELADGQSVAITISVGVAAFPVNGDSLEALRSAADAAMYRAKAAGRNRVNRA